MNKTKKLWYTRIWQFQHG